MVSISRSAERRGISVEVERCHREYKYWQTRPWLGCSEFREWKKAKGKERRDMQEDVRRTEEAARQSRALEMRQQGAWTKWEVHQRKVSWPEIWRLEPYRTSFMLRSVYDLLPSPANLFRWGTVEDPSCQLCGKRGTLGHVLTGCK